MSRGLLSRRHFLGSIVSSAVIHLAPSISVVAAETSNSFPFPPGIEVVDYRLTKSSGATRFLVEVFNSTTTAIDTPSIGVVLPHLDPDANFGWAVPMQEVLHPGSSAGLIGVAPVGIENDDEWGNPEWILCGEIDTKKAEKLLEWNIEIDYSLRIIGDNDVVADVTVANHGQALPTTVTVLGIVRDGDRRISGITVPLYLNSIGPGERRELPVRFGPSVPYIANPKNLINANEGVSVDFSFQPWPTGINPGCSPVMEWNR